MIASMLRLDRTDCKALKIEDIYSVHRVVYSLFPKQDNKTRDFLFVDKGGDWDCRQILIISERNPAVPKFGKIISKEISESFLNWDCYKFEVVLNPTKRDGNSRKIIPILDIDNLHKWFIQKAFISGFKVEPRSLQVSNIGVQSFANYRNGEKFVQTHHSATFKGEFKVVDKQVFLKSFKHGIGRAKGFGFGLLQIAPLKS